MWRRRRKRPSAAARETKRRLEKAKASLEQARADDERVEEVAARIEDLRRRNHFGPMISRALRGGQDE